MSDKGNSKFHASQEIPYRLRGNHVLRNVVLIELEKLVLDCRVGT
jgi:hypothetical protein